MRSIYLFRKVASMLVKIIESDMENTVNCARCVILTLARLTIRGRSIMPRTTVYAVALRSQGVHSE